MKEEKQLYSRTKEDLLNVIKLQGENCKKAAQKLRNANKEIKINRIEISGLNYKIRQLEKEIIRLKKEKKR